MLTSLLKLGRVSNVPTIWSNTLAGALLAGASPLEVYWVWLFMAMTLAYTGGMFLNDAFDAKIDAIERPERPIPAGHIQAQSVFAMGYGMLLASILLVWLSVTRSTASLPHALVSVLALCVCIVAYNIWHKQNPLSPVVMGLCRMLVYIGAGFALVPEAANTVFIGALVTLSYLIGLTYIAKQENKNGSIASWPVAFLAIPILFGLYSAFNTPITLLYTLLFGVWLVYSTQFIHNTAKRNVPKAVVSMIAGIALLDAIYISATGANGLAVAALACFLLTLFFQRYIQGT